MAMVACTKSGSSFVKFPRFIDFKAEYAITQSLDELAKKYGKEQELPHRADSDAILLS